MSAWHWWRLCLLVGAGLLLLTFCMGVVGIALQADIIGQLCTLTGFTGLVLFIGSAIYACDGPPRRPEHTRLTREQRKELNQALGRVELERQIKQLERQAGLYE